jgi:hypothetical protein
MASEANGVMPSHRPELAAHETDELRAALADGTRAQHEAGDLQASRDSFERAYRLAEGAGDAESMALAVLIANPRQEIQAADLVARAERDWLVAQLSSAVGLGGRTRAFPDQPERARVAVGKAIRRALVKITKADDVIGEHLRQTVHTGVRCSYWPG